MGQRLIITEEERNIIRRLHKSNIFEAGPEAQVATQQSMSSQKIMDLQNKLNEKFNSGLTADNKWGVNTANAVLNALKGLTQQQSTTQNYQNPKLKTPNNVNLKNPGLKNPYLNPKNPLNQPLT